MNIALTGGSGRLGRAIAIQALREGHQIVSIDRVAPTDPRAREGLRFHDADTGEYEQLVNAFEGCDALIHMAAIPAPGRHPDHVVHNNNVVGSYNAMRAGIEIGIERICIASSVNAIGLAFSRVASFDYFPIDERHPNRSEDAYSLSKWICEQQADSFVRHHEGIRIASMRFHLAVPNRAAAARLFTLESEQGLRQLWGYVRLDAAARACLLSLGAPFEGHEVFNVVAPNTTVDVASRDLANRFFPDVPIRGDFDGSRSFFSSAKAEAKLGWNHESELPQAVRPGRSVVESEHSSKTLPRRRKQT